MWPVAVISNPCNELSVHMRCCVTGVQDSLGPLADDVTTPAKEAAAEAVKVAGDPPLASLKRVDLCVILRDMATSA